MNKKRMIISLSVLAVAVVAVIGATGAFLSDDETSTGNVFTAGAIDLGLDNESYYNGVFNEGTSWLLDFNIEDDPPRQFFNFLDLKPGDYGEDTISLHVKNNEAWLCVDVTLTSNDDVDCTEPELQDDPTCTNPGVGDGELADNINFLWWADDGDNVLEEGEQTLPAGPLGALTIDEKVTVALADSNGGIWGDGPILTDDPEEVLYIGKAWCFGDIAGKPLVQGPYNGPDEDNDNDLTPGTPNDGGYDCTGGELFDNAAQTDSTTLDIAFRAIQARHNEEFECVPGDRTGTLTVTKVVDNGDLNGSSTVTDFSFTVDGGAPIPFEADGTNEVVVAAGAHVIAEPAVAGYTTTIGGADCDALGNVNVPAGGNASCTITNDDNPDNTFITVTKTVINLDGGDKQVADFDLFVDATPVTSGVQIPIAPGTYLVHEDGLFGYDSQISGDCDLAGNITIVEGNTYSCTITNDDIKPQITLVKDVTNDNGGTATAGTFTMRIDAVPLSNGSSRSVTANAPHTITEDAKTGYTSTGITGVSNLGVLCPAASGGNITLAPGDSVTCTIHNDDNL